MCRNIYVYIFKSHHKDEILGWPGIISLQCLKFSSFHLCGAVPQSQPRGETSWILKPRPERSSPLKSNQDNLSSFYRCWWTQVYSITGLISQFNWPYCRHRGQSLDTRILVLIAVLMLVTFLSFHTWWEIILFHFKPLQSCLVRVKPYLGETTRGDNSIATEGGKTTFVWLKWSISTK